MCLYSSTRVSKVAESPIVCWKVMIVIDGEHRGPYYDNYAYGRNNVCHSFKSILTETSNDLIEAARKTHSGLVKFIKMVGSLFNNKVNSDDELIWVANEGFHAYSSYDDAYGKWSRITCCEGETIDLVRCEIPVGARYYEGCENDPDVFGYCTDRLVIPELEKEEGEDDDIGRFYFISKVMFRNRMNRYKDDTLFVVIDNPYSMYPDDPMTWSYRGCFRLPGVMQWVFTNKPLEDIEKRLKNDFPRYKNVVFESERSKAQRMENDIFLGLSHCLP